MAHSYRECIGQLFEDLSDIFELSATYACPFILLGDINIHTEIVDNANTAKWQLLLQSYGLVQHVTSPTHRAGHSRRGRDAVRLSTYQRAGVATNTV